jgi:hypothetical protein
MLFLLAGGGGGPQNPPEGNTTCATYHTIVAGDTCWKLIGVAGGYGLPEGMPGVEALLALNPGMFCDMLQVGQRVCVGGGERAGLGSSF